MRSPQNTLRQFTDAAADAVAREIVRIQREAQRERELRDAEHRARLAELDTRIMAVADLERQVTTRLASLKDGEPGKSLTLEEVAPLIETATAGFAKAFQTQIATAVAALPPAEPGKDADPEIVRAMVAEEVKIAVAAVPAAENGSSVTVEDCLPVIDEALALAVAALPPPKEGAPGKSVTIEECLPAITLAIKEAVAAIPVPKDGAAGEKGERGVAGEKGDPGAPGSMIRVGEGEPSIAGKSDDIYLDSKSGNIYAFKS